MNIVGLNIKLPDVRTRRDHDFPKAFAGPASDLRPPFPRGMYDHSNFEDNDDEGNALDRGETSKKPNHGETVNSVCYPSLEHNQKGQVGDVDESINPCDRRPQ